MKRILFVDDEPAVLDGLRRMLRPRREEWEMVFACGGEAALGELKTAPFDVIVSDMRMPGLDGATLLRQVQERYPNVVRIVLSGHTELEAALRAIPIAHQFLTKPCNADTLQETVERACSLRALLGDDAIRSALGDVESLPPVPRVYAALMRALADNDAPLSDVTRLVEQDPAICAKVLQLVNSAFLGVTRKVTSIQQAVSLLGTNMLKNLALSAEVQSTFDGSRIAGFSFDAHQGHALAVAGIARRLLPDKRSGEDAFTAGMLHDVGKLVVAMRLPDHFRKVLATLRDEGRPMAEVEREIMAVTHAEIGAYLLGLWGLPYAIVEAVANHHVPTRIAFQRSLDVVAAVHIADKLAHESVPEEPVSRAPLDLAYLETLGVANELPAWRAMAAKHTGAGAAV
jgi:HD-like signal output (HDOD) protein